MTRTDNGKCIENALFTGLITRRGSCGFFTGDVKFMAYEKLIKAARSAREKAYAPYSGYSVGAALLCGNGEIYTGCNVENSSIGLTICAERTAAVKAISAGERHFKAICIIGGKTGENACVACFPCGMCRQFLSEFAADDMKVILPSEKDVQIYDFNSLFPHGFKL